MKIPECNIVNEFELPAADGIHGQFRNARLTSAGTLLVANMGLGFVSEYNADGKEINRWQLWWNKLTDVQRNEIEEWYEAWLFVTETKVIPQKPSWLD